MPSNKGTRSAPFSRLTSGLDSPSNRQSKRTSKSPSRHRFNKKQERLARKEENRRRNAKETRIARELYERLDRERKAKAARIVKATRLAREVKETRLACETKAKAACLAHQMEVARLTRERQLAKQEKLRILNQNNRAQRLVNETKNCRIETSEELRQRQYKKQFERLMKDYIYRIQIILKKLQRNDFVRAR